MDASSIARWAVEHGHGHAMIKVACLAFSISETCYRYQAKLNSENNVIADRPILPKCPKCGEEHRWSFIRALLQYALTIEPARHSALLEQVDRNLDSARVLYGGDQQYREMMKAAEEFFAKVDANSVNRP